MLSSKMSVGVHILTALAYMEGQALTSGQIAESVNTNPVVIRRLLGLFREAGFVQSKPGTGGGWILRQDPSRITILDVFLTVEPQCRIVSPPRSDPNPQCPLGHNIQGVLIDLYADAWRGMADRLAHSTIASVLATIRTRI